MVGDDIKNTEACPLKETMQLAKRIVGVEGWELEALKEYWEKNRDMLLGVAERVAGRIGASYEK